MTIALTKSRIIKEIAKAPVLFTEVLFRLTLIHIGLRWYSPRALLDKLKVPGPRLKESGAELERVFLFSQILNKRVFRQSTCLGSSLVLFWMAHPECRLSIGAKKENGLLQAHAWVEKDGQIYTTDLAVDRYECLLEVTKTIEAS